MIYVGNQQYQHISDIPGNVPSATIRSTPNKDENRDSVGIADTDMKGECGGTMNYVIAAVERPIWDGGDNTIFLDKLYFRTFDKRADVHPLALWAYDIMQASLIRA